MKKELSFVKRILTVRFISTRAKTVVSRREILFHDNACSNTTDYRVVRHVVNVPK